MNNVGEEFVDDGTYFPGPLMGKGEFLRIWQRPGEAILVDPRTNIIREHVPLPSPVRPREKYAHIVEKIMEGNDGK